MGFSLCSRNAIKNAVQPDKWTIGGTPVMSPTGLRDTGEALAGVGLDYATGGLSGAVGMNKMFSKGAQAGLATPLGTGLQLVGSAAGWGVGSGTTGIPKSPLLAWGQSKLPTWAGGTGGATPPAEGLTPAQQAADPALAGDSGQAWAPSAGETPPSAPPLAQAGGTAAGMSTAQKIALGLMGANTLLGKKQPLNPDLMAGATPAQTTSNSILDQYNKGQLNASDQYNIAKWAQDAKASKQQYYANAGLADSSMAKQDIAGIDAQASAMRDQALQNMLQGGLNAAGIANTATGQAVQLQIQQDQAAATSAAAVL